MINIRLLDNGCPKNVLRYLQFETLEDITRKDGQSAHLQMLPKNGVRTVEVISYLILVSAHMTHTFH
jgi:hypothetical protein